MLHWAGGAEGPLDDVVAVVVGLVELAVGEDLVLQPGLDGVVVYRLATHVLRREEVGEWSESFLYHGRQVGTRLIPAIQRLSHSECGFSLDSRSYQMVAGCEVFLAGLAGGASADHSKESCA